MIHSMLEALEGYSTLIQTNVGRLTSAQFPTFGGATKQGDYSIRRCEVNGESSFLDTNDGTPAAMTE